MTRIYGAKINLKNISVGVPIILACFDLLIGLSITVVITEHNLTMMTKPGWIIVIGLYSGHKGSELLYQGNSLWFIRYR